jgi:hypothetical protein
MSYIVILMSVTAIVPLLGYDWVENGINNNNNENN